MCAAIAAREAAAVLALTFDYGQRHRREVESAAAVASRYGMGQLVVRLDATAWGGSALTDRSTAVPRARLGIGQSQGPSADPGGGRPGGGRPGADSGAGAAGRGRAGEVPPVSSEVPATYVPARNTIFLAVAVAVAEAREIDVVYIGVNAVDYSGYPDCRPEFLDAFRSVARLGTKRGVAGMPVEIRAPLVSLSKREIVDLGARLEAPLDLSWSCYEGGRAPCGVCEACVIRSNAFSEAGWPDPGIGQGGGVQPAAPGAGCGS